MIPIKTIEDYLQLFETSGWVKKIHGNGYSCQISPEFGKGSVKVFGDPKKICYIKLDFSYSADSVFQFLVAEPYIEISNNSEDSITLDSIGTEKMIAERGVNCHINLGNLQVTQFFPAGTRFRKESLMIREQFLQERMFPFIEEELFKMTQAIRSGGISDSRISLLFKQINAFPLNNNYGKTYLTGKAYEALALLQDKVNQVQWHKVVLSPSEIERLKKAIFFMKKYYIKPLSLTDLSRQFAMNRNKMQAGFHTLTGYTVHECLLNIRVQEAITLLAATDRTILEIAGRVGFNSAKSLHEAFLKFLGVPPNHFRKALHG